MDCMHCNPQQENPPENGDLQDLNRLNILQQASYFEDNFAFHIDDEDNGDQFDFDRISVGGRFSIPESCASPIIARDEYANAIREIPPMNTSARAEAQLARVYNFALVYAFIVHIAKYSMLSAWIIIGSYVWFEISPVIAENCPSSELESYHKALLFVFGLCAWLRIIGFRIFGYEMFRCPEMPKWVIFGVRVFGRNDRKDRRDRPPIHYGGLVAHALLLTFLIAHNGNVLTRYQQYDFNEDELHFFAQHPRDKLTMLGVCRYMMKIAISLYHVALFFVLAAAVAHQTARAIHRSKRWRQKFTTRANYENNDENSDLNFSVRLERLRSLN